MLRASERRRRECSQRGKRPSSQSKSAPASGATASAATYDGRGICYLELGRGVVAKVDVTFLSGQSPVGDLEGPSAELVGDKTAFGSGAIRRWFGKTWQATQPDLPPA